MKKILTSLFLVCSLTSWSQDYMDKIAQECCSCLSKLSDTLSRERMEMEFGFCILAASSPYQKQLKKDHKIDFANIEEDGEKLGVAIGLKMVTVCPESFSKITGKISDSELQKENLANKNNVQTLYPIFEGTVTLVEKGSFVTFSVKDKAGKTVKFYWMDFIESTLDLPTTYENLLNTSLKITYEAKELFDHKLGEYRTYNIIRSLNKLP